MAKALHAVDYLAKPDKHPPQAVSAVFGDEQFLKRQVIGQIRQAVLGSDESDFSLCTFEGRSATLESVLDELATVAMFGGGKRLVLVEEADEFVTRYRGELEDYVAKPKSTGLLLLEVKTWPANTRLYKAVAAKGFQVDCSTPTAARLTKWLTAWAKRAHDVQLAASAAEVLIEMVGPELGLLDQELAKLALTAGPGGKVTAETVHRMVGSWRAKTAWVMLDAALAGNAKEAFGQLDRLLLAGESPIGILAQISASLRRFAAATRLILQAEQTGRRPNLSAALEQAGVKRFVLEKAQRQLRHLGRHRGGQIYRLLLTADLDLKGASALPPRLILERLIAQLSAPQKQAGR